jgi:hypothetical protein
MWGRMFRRISLTFRLGIEGGATHRHDAGRCGVAGWPHRFARSVVTGSAENPEARFKRFRLHVPAGGIVCIVGVFRRCARFAGNEQPNPRSCFQAPALSALAGENWCASALVRRRSRRSARLVVSGQQRTTGEVQALPHCRCRHVQLRAWRPGPLRAHRSTRSV